MPFAPLALSTPSIEQIIMKLRCLPTDFIVEEIPSYEILRQGEFALFKVTKTGLTTFACQKILALRLGVRSSEVSYAGLKDTHAQTTQYFSARAKDPKKGIFKEQNVSSEHVGFLDHQLKRGELECNKFIITVRCLNKKEVDRAKRNLKIIPLGIPNYFDSQRFGSLKGTKGFIAKDILKHDYESAVKKILTPVFREQKAQTKRLREFISAHWGEWDLCLEQIKKQNLSKTSERPLISYLCEHPQDFKGAFTLVFSSLRELYFSAYQSYLFNECVRRIIADHSAETYAVPYEAGTLIFERSWKTKPLFTVPLIADPIRDSEFLRVILAVLKKEGLELEDFRLFSKQFVSRDRDLLMFPKEFSIKLGTDERYPGKSKTIVSFLLPRGSYATAVTKALFEQ